MKEKEFKNFEKNKLNERAMNLINSISKKKLFKEKSSLMNNKDIILLFELFFISLGKKYDIMQFDTNDEDTKIKRWSYFCQYFNQNKNEYLKNILDYFGINKENKVNYQKLFTLYNIRLNVNEKINSKLNQMLIKFD